MVICELINNNQLVFYNFPFENGRKFMKFKIFLNSNKNLTYNLDKAVLNIYFSINDKVLINREVDKIIQFVENLFEIELQKDEKIEENIKEINSLSSNFRIDYEKLKSIKQSTLSDNLDFKNFVDFCDRTLKCKLISYQYTASFFLTIGQGGFDFSVPGSGKTIISYSSYNYLKANKTCDSILIIGPINSYNAWYDEYITCFGVEPDFTSLTDLSIDDAKTYLLASKHNHSEITFVNVDKAWRIKTEIISFLKDKKILFIIDEAHKEKNPAAKVTKAVLEISKYTKYRFLLTGTPMPNGYEDLYSLMKIYEPYEKVLPFNYSDLKKLTKKGASEQQQETIMNSLKPVYSRVSKAYLLKSGQLLPSVLEVIKCKLSVEQEEIYDFLNKMAFEIDDDYETSLNEMLMKAILIRKMQISANPGLLSKSIINTIEEYRSEYLSEYDEDNSDSESLAIADEKIRKAITKSPIVNLIQRFKLGKLVTPKNLKAVELALNIIKHGDKVLIWDVFVDNMTAIKELIESKSNVRVEIVNGTIQGKERQDTITRFRNGESLVLIANPATLAESISLHKCCQNAIYVNRNFNAAQFIQSKDRIHRINMPEGRTAHYYFLINENTVDETVGERLTLKEDRMIRILDSDQIEIGGSEMDNNSFMGMEDVILAYRK